MLLYVIGKEENVEDILTKQMLEDLASMLTGEWKKLATELNFPEDDISYFEEENNDETERALKMLTVWRVGYLLNPNIR